MINDITKKIHDTFGNGYRIYTENVEQGLKTPCFSVLHLSTKGGRYLQDRNRNVHQFMIQYIPSTKKAYSECSEMLNKLMLILVDVGNYHATKINGEIVNEILNVELVYTEFVQKTNDVENMQDYELKGW